MGGEETGGPEALRGLDLHKKSDLAVFEFNRFCWADLKAFLAGCFLRPPIVNKHTGCPEEKAILTYLKKFRRTVRLLKWVP